MPSSERRFYFYWYWCVICQAMRFQKLKAQMSADCESSHLCAGGKETESLVVPWLEGAAVPYWQAPRGESLWHVDCRQRQCCRNGRHLQMFSMAGEREGPPVRLVQASSVVMKRSTTKKTCLCQAGVGSTVRAGKHPGHPACRPGL